MNLPFLTKVTMTNSSTSFSLFFTTSFPIFSLIQPVLTSSFLLCHSALSSKLLTHEKDQFAQLAVDAVMRIKNTLNLEQIQIIKRSGGSLKVRYIHDIIFVSILIHSLYSCFGMMSQKDSLLSPSYRPCRRLTLASDLLRQDCCA